MTETMLPDLVPAYGELLMAVGAMALLMLGVFRGNSSTSLVSLLSAGLMIVTLFITVTWNDTAVFTFGDMFVADRFTSFMKLLVLVASALAVIMSLQYFKDEQEERFEYPVLMVLATLGMMVMVSANDLMSLYMGLELQSLSLYVLASIRRTSERSTEAGLKYFVLGALSSGMLLFGSSLVYGFLGSTNFSVLAETLSHAGDHGANIGAIVGMVLILSGLAFKISAVPFHMWTPDVYEGAPTPVTAFFAVAPKVAALALLVRVLYVPFGDMASSWSQVIIFMSLASMVLGSVAAVVQTNIKRLMAYSSIGHVGFALVGLAAGSQEGLRGLVIYMAIYLVMNVGTFACILSMRRKNGMVEDITDLSGLVKSRPAMAAGLGIMMLSLAGIPPLAGFLGKWYVFKAVVATAVADPMATNYSLIILAVIGVIASVIGAYYYLRVVKVMFFDAPADEFVPQKSKNISTIMALSATLLILFLLPQVNGPVLEYARMAAAALIS
ncbi:NADH-quinone oxidoreductase subunit NuoN [Paremcibacter congregatus]|uniref:NADH-quinone oxidoreductase subunit N n=1 Tax=Paremcibacter congregatus TaxID=2043170 RepID=A0A2G4YSM0_9PROT|nr:NADH-quinone oxidoreductase subunit NuoN [Paremcibacter congregatus]PHZ85325.1 NADH-quinone oxidoreductase subunit NuoN [Paremcibacter congregatus]QDE27743.1 NADH-quinone oxidoreductase subunit NuoN [Paremcibacter congregatus]